MTGAVPVLLVGMGHIANIVAMATSTAWDVFRLVIASMRPLVILLMGLASAPRGGKEIPAKSEVMAILPVTLESSCAWRKIVSVNSATPWSALWERYHTKSECIEKCIQCLMFMHFNSSLLILQEHNKIVHENINSVTTRKNSYSNLAFNYWRIYDLPSIMRVVTKSKSCAACMMISFMPLKKTVIRK